jgi:hypothetical protein
MAMLRQSRKWTMTRYNVGPMATISDFASKHWVLGGIVTSLLWFVAGRQYFFKSATVRSNKLAVYCSDNRSHIVWLVRGGKRMAWPCRWDRRGLY